MNPDSHDNYVGQIGVKNLLPSFLALPAPGELTCNRVGANSDDEELPANSNQEPDMRSTKITEMMNSTNHIEDWQSEAVAEKRDDNVQEITEHPMEVDSKKKWVRSLERPHPEAETLLRSKLIHIQTILRMVSLSRIN